MKKVITLIFFLFALSHLINAQGDEKQYTYNTKEFTIDTVKNQVCFTNGKYFVLYDSTGVSVKSGYAYTYTSIAFLKRPAVYMIVISTNEKKFEKYKNDYKKAKNKLYYFKLN